MISSSRPALLAAAALLCFSLVPAGAHERQGNGAPQAPAAAPAPTVPEADFPLDPRFSPDRVKADVSFLADDLLEGRDTGSPGYEIAARYVAQRFAALGLTPMGDSKDGKTDWLQRITFQKTQRVADAPAGIAITGPQGSATFAYGVDALVGQNANEPQLDVSAPLVFVGYGMVNSRLGVDDYAGLDVKGKIVVMLRGFPEGMPSEPAAYVTSEKGRIAQARGAIGIIQIDTDASAKQRPWERRLQSAAPSSVSWVAPDGKAHDETPNIRANGSVADKGAQAIFAGAAKSLAQVRKEAARKGARPKGFALKTSARLFNPSTSSRISAPNVVAMIPGSDPALAGDYVVLSAHLDHIGISPARPGDAPDKDRINNGAMDNAAGVATLLEVARVLAEDKAKPRRSILFVVVAAEEKGLLGAQYFAKSPTVPIGRIVGNVNLDMPVLTYAFDDVVAYGAEHSTIGKVVEQAVAPMKIRLAPDPWPEETIFVRSDHYMFVKEGVPAVFLATGFGNGGEKAFRHFEDNFYHRPGDDLNLPIEWRAGARFAEANYRIARALADGD
ncbi:MAG: M20/M25/M40 family metallo-hydrolase, partial [Sphingomonadales bacterium]|nr:M20/M25/M40 family metallo-hydrolase [Sphingomonadales bacterium]